MISKPVFNDAIAFVHCAISDTYHSSGKSSCSTDPLEHMRPRFRLGFPRFLSPAHATHNIGFVTQSSNERDSRTHFCTVLLSFVDARPSKLKNFMVLILLGGKRPVG